MIAWGVVPLRGTVHATLERALETANYRRLSKEYLDEGRIICSGNNIVVWFDTDKQHFSISQNIPAESLDKERIDLPITLVDVFYTAEKARQMEDIQKLRGEFYELTEKLKLRRNYFKQQACYYKYLATVLGIATAALLASFVKLTSF